MGLNHDLGRQRQETILDWLARFPVLRRSHLEALMKDSYGGRVRPLNNSLKALADRKAVRSFQVAAGSELAYSLRPGPTDKTPHALAIADVFTGLYRTAMPGVRVEGAAEITLDSSLRTDALVVTGSHALMIEVHRASNSFGTKFDRYQQLEYQAFPWFHPGLRVALWIVCPPAAVQWLEKRAATYRAAGMTIKVSPLERAVRFGWKEAGFTPT